MLLLTYAIHKSIDAVYDYLTDMQKFASVHPVITSIDHVADNNYLVHETLRLGFIPYSFTYPVTVERDFAGRKVCMKAVVRKMTTIEMKYALTAGRNNSTEISENITFKSLLPIEGMMGRIFRKQHEVLFRNIEAAH